MTYLRRNRQDSVNHKNDKEIIRLMGGNEVLGEFNNWKSAENAFMLAIKENMKTRKYFDEQGRSTLRLE